MGAPGTLIPADVLNGKDTRLKYNPQPSRLPSLDTTSDAEVSTTQPGQNSLSGYNLSLGTTSLKPETLLSSLDASINDGVGTSGLDDKVPSPNQLDHSLSQAIGSSSYKGGRAANLTGDSVRIHQNVVPYSPKSSEDPKNLFADLNPFQIKGSGKTVVQNDLANEIGKLQFPKSNIVGSRPPAPLMWKNRQAWNEVPKENECDSGQGLSVKNKGANKGNTSSAVSRSSKVPSRTPKLPENSFNNPGERGDGALSDKKFKFASSEHGPNRLSLGKDISFNNKERYHTEDMEKITRPDEQKESMRDRLIGTSMKLMETEGASCSLDLSANYVDPEIDDVGECEIVWEDLVLGERIGLVSFYVVMKGSLWSSDDL
ncbi:UNVERIFIED_CONTAM: Serine/threonine-protein kinase EDR1 [Sesamum indicum]